MIDLKAILKNQNKLSRKEFAALLFPNAQYPLTALNRTLQGKRSLKEIEISRLAIVLDIAIPELFTGSWKPSKTEKGKFTLKHKSFRAELDMNTGVSRIYDTDTMLHESMVHSNAITLTEYIDSLNTIINRNNGSN